MSKYLGLIEIKNSYVNFKPTHEIVGNGSIKYLTQDERRDLFRDSQFANVNLYYRDPSKKPAQMFSNNEVIIIDFDNSDLEENYSTLTYLRNPTGYKMELDYLFDAQKIIELDSMGIYYVVNRESLDGNYKKNKIIKTNDDFINSNYRVLIDLTDESECFLGPYNVKNNDDIMCIDTELEASKYVLKGYRTGSLDDIEKIEVSVGNGQFYYFLDVNLNKAFLEKTDIDVISDDELISDFKRTIERSQIEDNKIDLDNIGAILEQYKKSELLGGTIPEKIKNNRVNKISALLNDEKYFSDIANVLTDNILNQLVKQQDKKEYSELIQRYIGTPEFLSRIQKFEIMRQENKRLEDEKNRFAQDIEKEKLNLDDLKRQEEKIKKKLSEPSIKNAKTTSKIPEINIDVNNDPSIRILEKAKNEKLAELKQLTGYTDLARISKELDEQIKNKNSRLTELNKNLKDIDKKLNKMFENSTEKAMDFAFDGMLSNKMLRQAAEWENSETQGDYDNKISDIKNLPISQMKGTELIDYCVNNIQKVRPNYQKNDIINILICITQGFLTVFSGDPGTGKTSICRIVSATMGLNQIAKKLEPYNDGYDANRYLSVSVERGWITKRDFVGYYNPLTKTFDKSNRRIYDCLNILDLEAKGNQVDLPYIIMLDEANLSPMEYYWADFMNICDSNDGTESINLGNDFCYRIPSNLRFIATINNDHTTESLSPRLIDRAWIIRLPKVKPSNTSDAQYCNGDFDFISWDCLTKTLDEDIANVTSMTGTIAETYSDIIAKCSQAGISISPRSDAAVKKYWSTAQKWFDDNEKYGIDKSVVALDYAIAERVLPHFNGSGEDFRKKLDELKELCNDRNLLMSASVIGEIIEKGNAAMQYYQYFA